MQKFERKRKVRENSKAKLSVWFSLKCLRSNAFAFCFPLCPLWELPKANNVKKEKYSTFFRPKWGQFSKTVGPSLQAMT